MSLDALKAELPDFAKDIRLNISRVLDTESGNTLDSNQVAGVALACAFATQNERVISAIQNWSSEHLDEAELKACKSAATIMAMNNVYYRSVSMVNAPDFQSIPAGLRMQVIGKPGISSLTFELYCLAVSAINNCKTCVGSHASKALGDGLSQTAIHAAIRIAAVISATAQAIKIAEAEQVAA